jgi:hypothetical protein
MIEAYKTEEAINCYTKYIQDERTTLPQHEGRTSGMGCIERKVLWNIVLGYPARKGEDLVRQGLSTYNPSNITFL